MKPPTRICRAGRLRPPAKTGGIIAADRNFGCGSSRETAVYALAEFGVRAVIAPSFGDIFFNNCYKNRLLPVILPNETCVALRNQLRGDTGARIRIDLEHQQVWDLHNQAYAFDIHPLRKKSLIEGIDDIALTQGYLDTILTFERRYRTAFPWVK
ncbi:3-isopropylmalate dehydratase small subunit [Sodalis sp. RH21]|uniref:3-isopropylmalate dehydratase small subunit n=1 Tax=unclassified Sodalis (in: enterobacteria) TaxID=2636512 RepID=UPI0039B63386